MDEASARELFGAAINYDVTYVPSERSPMTLTVKSDDHAIIIPHTTNVVASVQVPNSEV